MATIIEKEKNDEIHITEEQQKIIEDLVKTAHEETETEAQAPISPPPSPEQAKKPFYRRTVVMAIAAILLIAGAAYGAHYYSYASAHESTDDAFIEGDVVQISPKVSGHITKVYVADNQEVREGDLLAEIDSRDYQAQVQQAQAALDAALAKQRAAEINVRLTTTTSRAGIQQATSAVELARSGVQTSQAQAGASRDRAEQSAAQLRAAVSAADQARAQVAAAEAEATRARADVSRYRQLYDKDEVSRQQLDAAVAAGSTAAAQLEAARQRAAAADAQIAEARAAQQAAVQNIGVSQSQIGEATARIGDAEGRLAAANAAPHEIAATRAQVSTAGADVERARAVLEQAQLMLSDTRIYAPQTGRVTRKSAEVGNFVTPGQALMAIVPRQVWVIANFKETQLTEMRPGQSVEVRVDAYPGKVFTGHVDSLQSGTGSRFSMLPAENATGNYVKVVQRVPVKIVLDESADAQVLLAPGMSVTPEVKVK